MVLVLMLCTRRSDSAGKRYALCLEQRIAPEQNDPGCAGTPAKKPWHMRLPFQYSLASHAGSEHISCDVRVMSRRFSPVWCLHTVG